MNIIGIGASPRKNSNSTAMLRAALSGAQAAGAETDSALLRRYRYSSCIGCEKCRADKKCTGLNDGMTLLYPKIEAAQGLILSTPVHFYNVTAMMKAFIDRLYCYFDFDMESRPRAWSSRLAGQGRKAVILAIGEQPDEEDAGFVMDAMRLPLESLGYELADSFLALNVFDAGRVRKDDEVMARCEEAGRELAMSDG
jgi:multimeric flavodoxin WrbA